MIAVFVLWLGCSDKSTDNDMDGFTADVDCNDENHNVFPGAIEYCDGLDNNCNNLIDDLAVDRGRWYWDYDGDGFGDQNGQQILTCPNNIPAQAVSNNDDCNDSDENIHPNAVETCNRRDDNCDQEVDNDPIDPTPLYEDNDGDGFGVGPIVVLGTCEFGNPPEGYAFVDGDCNDEDGFFRTIEEDQDCDGSLAEMYGGDDCDDNDPNLGSRAFDADCDGTWVNLDCNDQDSNSTTKAEDADCDGIVSSLDCDDSIAGNPLSGASEICAATSCKDILDI